MKPKDNRTSKHDLRGKTFGRLTVISLADRQNKKNRWLCRCACGVEKCVRTDHLLSGASRSCGCLSRDRATSIAKSTRRHGESNTRLHHIWAGMKQRCFDEKDSSFPYYGGRGITVCTEWKNSYIAFRDWALANGYRDDLSIDRVDVNGNYCPENCRWATMKQQQNNRSNNRVIEYGGESYTLAEWAEIKGVSESILRARLDRGWSFEDAISEPSHKGDRWWRGYKTIELNGEVHTINEWSALTGIPNDTIRNRMKRGLPPSEILSKETLSRKDTVYLDFCGTRKTLKEWSSVTGIDYKLLHARFKKGWSPERILSNFDKK